jgi:hypothetical protein
MLFGLMFYYFNNRLSIIETTMVKQNHVLSDFITNIKSNTIVHGGSGQTSNHGATLEAMQASKEVYPINAPNDMEYIEVTDSEDDSSASSEDSSTNEDPNEPIEVPVIQSDPVKVIRLGEVNNIQTLNMILTEKNVEPAEDEEEEDDDGVTIDLQDGSTMDYSKMKVSQLRHILADKGIVAKSKRKNELLKALQDSVLHVSSLE